MTINDRPWQAVGPSEADAPVPTPRLPTSLHPVPTANVGVILPGDGPDAEWTEESSRPGRHVRREGGECVDHCGPIPVPISTGLRGAPSRATIGNLFDSRLCLNGCKILGVSRQPHNRDGQE
jgi:hypothetical protein